MTDRDDWGSRLQTDRPHSARVWDYLLGGKNHYLVDSRAGDMILQNFPEFAAVARAQRRFLVRAVRFMARDAGIRQFLDIGTGLPTADNTHEVAQGIAPESRIVYVDNDPIVLAHADALLGSTPEGECAYLDADVRDPRKILAEAAATLDFDRPIGLILLGIIGQVSDEEGPGRIVSELVDALPSGSYVALSDGTATSEALQTAVSAYNSQSVNTYHLRSPEQIGSFLDGLSLVEPGLVRSADWRPDADPSGLPQEQGHGVGAVAFKE
ncbi:MULTISPECIES: SAM-dependent methyltransferase [unclassified Streptomyces]|uniref:SAM-dependent methyltransferase n=1 Tax=unclassified Streptomyces TaxID=2593676 RepID=UPI00136AAF85|nr:MULTISPECIES: SAM-dependent methyltransferase [unclassified Streptomyces]MCW5250278.1 SAM-dependent methyltransferase [Streptomyces sp. SHP 1-2]MYU25291.1 SAM-dependent methyltransferase [Streptomyces sp. SID8352]